MITVKKSFYSCEIEIVLKNLNFEIHEQKSSGFRTFEIHPGKNFYELKKILYKILHDYTGEISIKKQTKDWGI